MNEQDRKFLARRTVSNQTFFVRSKIKGNDNRALHETRLIKFLIDSVLEQDSISKKNVNIGNVVYSRWVTQ